MITKDSILKKIDWKKFNRLRIQTWINASIELTAFMHNEWLIIDMNLGWSKTVDS